MHGGGVEGKPSLYHFLMKTSMTQIAAGTVDWRRNDINYRLGSKQLSSSNGGRVEPVLERANNSAGTTIKPYIIGTASQ
jgi:hypothetical protein